MESFIKAENIVTDEKFDEIADLFLNKSILSIDGDEWRICEIEFYLNSKEHPDLYTHSLPQQKNYGTCYFHRFKNGNYKSGTFKCMDFALGSDDFYCGVLLRSMFNPQTNEFIEGPCLCVNKILSLCGKDHVKELDGSCLIDGMVKLLDVNLEHEQMYKGFRIGLKPTHPEFFERKYRYITNKNKIKKLKKSLVPFTSFP